MIAIASDHGGYDLKERVKRRRTFHIRIWDVTARQAAITLCLDMQRQGLWQTVPARRAS